MRPYLSSLVFAVALALPSSASAVRYDFAGTFSTSDIASSFAVEGGFASGTGNYSGYVEFNPSDPGPNFFTATSAFLSIGAYTFDFANPLFSTAEAAVFPPSDFSLLFLSFDDFSTANLSEFLSFTLSFPTATPGIGQNPSPGTGSVSINFVGDSDALFGAGDVTQFDVADAPSVPEPGTWITMICGFGLLGGALRFRRRQISQVA